MDTEIPELILNADTMRWIGFFARAGATPRGRYVSRTGLERLSRTLGFPRELTELWWGAVRIYREPGYPLPLTDPFGSPFRLPIPSYLELASGIGHADFDVSPPWYRRTDQARVPAGLRERNLREEAIASCVLDGIDVDRAVLGELVASGRPPEGRAEQAVLNVYTVLRDVVPSLRGGPLTMESILTLQRLLIAGTAEDEDTVGRLRRGGEIPRELGAAPLDVPFPGAGELPSRLGEFFAFADPQAGQDMLFPEVRAILAHYWIAHDRPFVEGNGRLARALFYAVGRRSTHPTAVELVSISAPFARAPEIYFEAFRDGHADENDTGYLVYAQLRVLRRAIRRMLRVLGGIRGMRAAVESELPGASLNDRQVEALWELRSRHDRRCTIDVHRRRHGVVYQTARTDLLELAELGLLEQERDGRTFVFTPSSRLAGLAVE